jgi:polyribonucleotide nucleotidyltransferase
LCNNKDIELNETFAFSTNLLRDPKTDEFEKKPLEIALKYAQTVRLHITSP